MRFAGRIQDWNDEKGYGFVVPNGGGDRSFIHIKAFRRGSRRPVDGDLVSYAVARDGQGRSNAVQVLLSGQLAESPSQLRRRRHLPIPGRFIAAAALAAVVAMAVAGWLPAAVAIAYFILSGVSFLLYFSDKSAAGRKGVRRTPENTLHLVDLLGGWPGGLLAQQAYRHKTVKTSFQLVFWATVTANIVLMGWLVWSGRIDAVRGWFGP